MIPDNPDGLMSARSYGLIESCGQGKTDVDQSDGDDAYFELCSEVFGPEYVKIYY